MAEVVVDSYTFVLFFLYLFLTLIASFQIARIIYYGHNIWGWQFGFLSLCVPFSLMRALFFILLDIIEEDSISATFAIYWIPTNLQFSTFSLLILFYAHIYHKTEKNWENRKTIYAIVYVVSNLIYIVVTTVSIALVADHGEQADWENKLWNVVSAVTFSILVCVLAYYGLRVAALMRMGKAQISFQPKKSSNLQVVSVTVVIFLIFTSRALFNVLSAADVLGFTVESGLELNDLGMFILFFIWEIVPTTLVIILFWRIPSPKRNKQVLMPAQGPYKVNLVNEHRPGYPVGPPTSLFDNPQRYESDDDSPHYSPSPRFYLPSNSPYSPYDTNPTPPSYGALGHQVADDLSSS